MIGKETYFNNIGKLNEIKFDGDCAISEAILPSTVGYGDGMSIIISDFLTDNDFEAAIDHLASKKRDILCIQILSEEELNPKARGKMHFFDSEDTQKYYRRNINKEIVRAYYDALNFITSRVSDCCHARGAEYMLISAEDLLSGVFFDKLMSMGVLK